MDAASNALAGRLWFLSVFTFVLLRHATKTVETVGADNRFNGLRAGLSETVETVVR